MNANFMNGIFEKYAFLAFLVSLFLFFTPFESGGANLTMMPRYVVAALSIFIVGPLLLAKKMQPRWPSVLIAIVCLTIVFHTIVVKQTPPQFPLLISANIFLAILIYEASFHLKKQFESAVCCLLVVNCIAIFIQAFIFHFVSHSIIDFHKFIFGSASRFAEDYLNIARFTGIQVEPGTYANYIGCLLAILLLSSGFSKRNVWVSCFTILSILVTSSGSALYFAPVLIALMGFLWRDKIRAGHVLFLTVGIFLYLHFSGFLEHLEDRFLGHDDGSLSLRVIGINSYKSLSLEDKFIGVGFGDDPCAGCHYQDIGAAFNLFTRGGGVVTIGLLTMFFRMLVVNGLPLSIILFLIPLNEKMFFYEAPLWIFLLFALTSYKNGYKDRVKPQAPQPLQVAGAMPIYRS